MHDFNTPLECKECETDNRYQLFVDLDGNGLKCVDCLHKCYVFKPKKGEKRGAQRKRMATAWERMKTRSKF